jgi:hypothetical protein
VSFCFFVDGLDEYEGEHHDIVATLRDLARSEDFKICVSSRPWNVFEHAFGKDPERMLTLQDLTRDDILAYINDRLVQNPLFVDMRAKDSRCKEVVQEVITKAHGVFLLVILVIRQLIKSLENGDSVSDLERRLDEMPPELEDYLQHMLDRIDVFYRKQTAQILLLRLRSRSAPPLLGFLVLDQEDLLAARLAGPERVNADDIDKMEDKLRKQIRGRCQDLLEVSTGITGRAEVEFLHRTVRDFLYTKEIANVFHGRAGEDFDATETLCRACVVSIRRLEPGDWAKVPLSQLGTCVRDIKRGNPEASWDLLAPFHDDLNGAIREQSRDDGRSSLDIENLLRHRRIPERDRFISFAVQDGFTTYVERCLQLNPQLLKDRDPPLLCFALYSLRYGFMPPTYDHPLLKLNMVLMLLQHGADPNAHVTISNGGRQKDSSVTAWEFYLLCGRPSIEVTEAMIKHGARYIERTADIRIEPFEQLAHKNFMKKGEKAILTQCFGAAEAERLLRIRSPDVDRRKWKLWSWK